MMKRQRLGDAASEPPLAVPPAAPLAVAGLPAEMWAHVLQYAYFDEVLTCTAVSKFFRIDVTGQLTELWIRSGKSMDVVPAVVERFSRVETVHINAISRINAVELRNMTRLSQEDYQGHYHMDCAALQYAAPFLSSLPKITCCRFCDIDHNDQYELTDESRYPQVDNPNEKWAGLIQSVCRAYRTGKLSDQVEFVGLIPLWHPGGRCVWKRNMPKISSYRDDVVCQMCDMICNSFPPLQTLQFVKDEIPCIKFENIAKIVRFRDEEEADTNMTKALAREMKYLDCYECMCPPNYTTKCNAILVHEDPAERMQRLISNGADPTSPLIQRVLLDAEEQEEWHHGNFFLGSKRIIEVEAYKFLKRLGFDVNERDFEVIDMLDDRTDVTRFDIQQELDSGIPISEIDSISSGIRFIVQQRRRDLNLTPDAIVLALEDMLPGVDFSARRDAINTLVAEVRAEYHHPQLRTIGKGGSLSE